MYFFWTSLYLGFSALVYHFLVRPQANPAQSRFFIVFALLLSCLLSGIGMWAGPGLRSAAAPQVLWLPEVVVQASSGAHANLEQAGKGILEALSARQLLLNAVLLVTALLFFRVAGSLIYLLARIRYSRRTFLMGVTVLPVRGQLAPFSFFHFVFLPIDMLEHPGLKEIIEHERAHITQWHSLDLLLVEFMTVVFWFHPAVWLFRRELKMQHEFEADRAVIDRHSDKRSYQKLLLEVSAHGMHIPITTTLNYPPLKKRFMMMNTTKKASLARTMISMLTIVPLFAVAFFVQSCSEQPKGETGPDAMQAEVDYTYDVIYTVADEFPVFPGGETARQQFMSEHLRYPLEAMQEGLQGTVFVAFVVRYDGRITDAEVLRGVSPEIDEEAIRVVNLMPDWEPAIRRDEPVSVRFNMPIRFRLD